MDQRKTTIYSEIFNNMVIILQDIINGKSFFIILQHALKLDTYIINHLVKKADISETSDDCIFFLGFRGFAFSIHLFFIFDCSESNQCCHHVSVLTYHRILTKRTPIAPAEGPPIGQRQEGQKQCWAGLYV